MFQDGKLKLKCTAFLDEIFMRSEEVSVEQIQPQSTMFSSRDEYVPLAPTRDIYRPKGSLADFQPSDNVRTVSGAVIAMDPKNPFNDLLNSKSQLIISLTTLIVCSSFSIILF